MLCSFNGWWIVVYCYVKVYLRCCEEYCIIMFLNYIGLKKLIKFSNYIFLIVLCIILKYILIVLEIRVMIYFCIN